MILQCKISTPICNNSIKIFPGLKNIIELTSEFYKVLEEC